MWLSYNKEEYNVFTPAFLETFLLYFQNLVEGVFLTIVITLCSGFTIFTVILIFIIKGKYYSKFPAFFSLLIWILLLSIASIYYNIIQKKRTTDNIAVIFYIIIVCYIMLPLSKRLSLFLGIVTVLIAMITSALIHSVESKFLVEEVSLLITYQTLPLPTQKKTNKKE